VGELRPTAEVRIGRIKATVWANVRDDGKGTWYSVQLVRLYRDGEEWRTSQTFGRDDLLLVAKVADLAHSRVFELEAGERDREEAPPAGETET
jgi:hypothetical protein